MTVSRSKFLHLIFAVLLFTVAKSGRAQSNLLYMTTSTGGLATSSYTVTSGQVTAIATPTALGSATGLTGGMVLFTNDIMVANATTIYRYSYSGTLLGTVATGYSGISGMAISTDGTTLYIADKTAGTLNSLNLRTGAKVASAAAANMNSIQNVVVANSGGGDIVWFTGTKGQGANNGYLGYLAGGFTSGAAGTLAFNKLATGTGTAITGSLAVDVSGTTQYVYYGYGTTAAATTFTISGTTPTAGTTSTSATGYWATADSEFAAASYPGTSYQVVTSATGGGLFGDTTASGTVQATGTSFGTFTPNPAWIQFYVTAKTADPTIPEPGTLGLTIALSGVIYAGTKRRMKVLRKTA